MRFTTAIALALSATVEAHYTFPNVGTTAEWAVVRQTKNFQSNGPVTDVTSKDMRCYQMKDAADVLDVTAGSSVAYHAKASISHPGPMSAYIAKVPEGQDVKTWDPEGKVWSKIYGDMPNLSAGGMSWPSQGAKTVNIAIPKCLADGDYLLRVEHVGLHSASAAGGAQFYISCAQISVTGGSGTYSPKNQVAFPGAFPATDPGIMINIYYPVPTSYTPPGPPVESC